MKKYCIDCGKELSKNIYNHCKKCFGKSIFGSNNPMFGKTQTKESNIKRSLKLKGRIFSQEHKDKIGLKHKNKIISLDTKLKMSKSKFGKSLINRGTFKKGHIPWITGKIGIIKQTEETCIKKSLIMKALWKNKEYRDKVLYNTFKSLHLKPNKPETIIKNLLNILYPNEYKYVGNGEIWIEGFNPDFININGQKKIIEAFGDYWHNMSDYIERDKRKLKAYKELGYSTLIIWEHELKDIEKVKNRIVEFHNVNKVGVL